MLKRVCAFCSHLHRMDGNPRTSPFTAFVQFIVVRERFRQKQTFSQNCRCWCCWQCGQSTISKMWQFTVCCVVHCHLTWACQKWISKILISIRAQRTNTLTAEIIHARGGREMDRGLSLFDSVREISGVMNEFRVCLWFFPHFFPHWNAQR